MDQFYKGHRIEVSGWLDGDSWFASLFIYYSKGPQNILVTFAMRASSPSARTLSTSQVSEPAHGSKYKVNRGQEFLISGYTGGNPFYALIVGYYEGERLLYAAKVRNGFVPLVRREVAGKLKGLEIDTCPFANLPEKKRTQWALTKEEMKNCV